MGRFLGGSLVLLLLLGGGCSRAAAPAASPPPRRIVSLFPSWTEVLCALGLEERLVGRSRYCTFPPSVRRLPSVGDNFSLHVEGLLRLRPDLVVVYDEELARRLGAAGVRAVSVRAETLAEVFAAYRRLGELAGVPGRGRELAARVAGEIRRAARRFARYPRRRFLFVVDPEGGYVVGRRNFVHELLTAVGGVNVAADAGRSFPRMSLEAALRRDPEVILYTGAPGGYLRGLAATRAGRTGRVHRVAEEFVTRSGPRLGRAAWILGRLLHAGDGGR